MKTFHLRMQCAHQAIHAQVEARDKDEAELIARERNPGVESVDFVRELKCSCADYDGFVSCPIHL